jgi:hypothetical protein
VLCASVDAATREAAVVAVDQGQSICASGDELARLEAIALPDERRLLGLTGLTRRARKSDIDATLTLRSGTARLRGGDVAGHLQYVPGFVAALQVRLPGALRLRAPK